MIGIAVNTISNDDFGVCVCVCVCVVWVSKLISDEVKRV